MKKKENKKEELTKKDLAQMLGGFENRINSKIDDLGKSLGSKIQALELRITKLESYMKEGFNSLNNKIDEVDARLSHQIEGLGRRIDDLADNKISRMTYKELESRVIILESKVLPKTKK